MNQSYKTGAAVSLKFANTTKHWEMKSKMDKRAFGPWALVTGASSGIGKEFAIQLAASGIHLVLVARRLSLLETLGQQLQKQYGIQYRAIGADLADESALARILQVTEPLDIGLVVSNAGAGAPGEFIDKKQEDLLKMVNTSVIAHLKIAHHFGRLLAEKKRGGIILVSAMGADHGLPFMANDAGTRAYIRSLGLGLHEELKRHGVRVTVLIPSPTDTPIVEQLGFQPEKMPMKPISVEQCVVETLIAHKKNRPSIIPGRLYRLMDALTPDALARKMFGKLLAEGNGIRWRIEQ